MGTLRRSRRRRRRGALASVALAAALLTSCSYETSSVAPALPAPAQTSRILASDGTLLTALQAEQNRDVVSLDDMPGTLVDAVVAIEDERFWLHNGVDLRGIARAAKSNAEAGEIAEGGSTITQQYVKNALLDPSQTVNRKVNEAVLAIRLEQSYSKETILEQYLNTIYFGHGAYGAQAAADTYFGKKVGALTLPESALLAGVIQAPSANDPYLNYDAALERRNVVLDRLLTLELIDQPTRDEAVATAIVLAPVDEDKQYRAPHFVDAVIDFMLTDPRFGDSFEQRRDLLFKGGLRITTTVDLEMQTEAEQAVASILDNPDVQPDAAVVALEPATGFVRAMVGGRDYFGTSDHAKVNLAMGSGRPAGSTFKPFVLAAGLEQGMALSRRYPAPAKLTIPMPGGQEPWEVFNYGETSGGTVNLTDATTWSYNTAYAQLMRDVGPVAAVDMASRLGISSPLQAVPALVLGTENVTVLEMAGAYGTFANRGTRVPPVLVSRITKPDGTVLYEHATESYPALPDPAIADQVNFVLQRVVNRGTGAAAALDDRAVAGKTGTTENYGDAWFVGYTPQLATAVWVGYPEGQVPMVPDRANVPFRVAGGTWPAEIWRAFMVEATKNQPVLDFAEPDDASLRATDRAPFNPAPTTPPPATAAPQPAPTTTAAPKKDDEKDKDKDKPKEDDKKDTTTSTSAPPATEAPPSTVVTIPTSTTAGGPAGGGNADPKGGSNG